MFPSIMAGELQETLLDYLKTTFDLKDPEVQTQLLEFLQGSVNLNTNGKETPGKIFKGPYLKLTLPFVKNIETDHPLEVKTPFTPYRHQVQAFRRLHWSEASAPKPTLITTGTGSGKTESFLYPLLDYCYRRRRQRGKLKAIILYPMNALIEDQAKRLAAMLHQLQAPGSLDDEPLANYISAGVYTGSSKSGDRRRTLTEKHLIYDRQVIREHVPDILLTNYKMLDLLLMRKADRKLWADCSALKYLVLDELHTYEGVQGSDVACLLRRLQYKVQKTGGSYTPVGTSATLADQGKSGDKFLLAFARELFREDFSPEAVIRESRISKESWFDPTENQEEYKFPNPSPAAEFLPKEREAVDAYLKRQGELWLGLAPQEINPRTVGKKLLHHHLFGEIINRWGNKLAGLSEITQMMAAQPEFYDYSRGKLKASLLGFLALVSYARDEQDKPLLSVQVQLWVREMSRLLRKVDKTPRFFWYDSLLNPQDKHLPAVYCRNCGAAGWMSVQDEGEDKLSSGAKLIWRQYAEQRNTVRYIFPAAPQKNTKKGNLELFEQYFCPSCLRLSEQPSCPDHPEVEQIKVVVSAKRSGSRSAQHCPLCDSAFAIAPIGSQAASLSSVLINHLYQSRFNRDKKLLAFTDSVQDAAHRSAFFGQRTYRFILRTAIQTVIDEEIAATTRGSTPLAGMGRRVMDYWSRQLGTERQMAVVLLPPDLQDHREYQKLIKQKRPQDKLNKNMRALLENRIQLEVVKMFGFLARIGRSLQKTGCSTAWFDSEALEKATAGLKRYLFAEYNIGTIRVRSFLKGFLMRAREQGAIYHPWLEKFIKTGGNRYWVSHVRMPNLGIWATQNRLPRFIVTRGKGEDFNRPVSLSANDNWYTLWAKKTCKPGLQPGEINDIYGKTLEILEETGIFGEISGEDSKGTYYYIKPEALHLYNELQILTDGSGDTNLVVPKEVAADWVDSNSLAFRGDSTYQVKDKRSQEHSYYRQFYRSRTVERIFASEHSSLVDDKQRRQIEKAFRGEGNRTAAPNLLTCTPTMEMGIDVGDLSSTMVCSIPPGVSNYLQRIGRAGRKTGNSIVLALANTRPHDLYFFDEPKRMIEGRIEPPGIYLDAPEVLQRHFFSFCLDNWAGATPEEIRMPSVMARINQSNFRESFFENYLKVNIDQLREDFLELFKTQISQENRKRLENYAGFENLASLYDELTQNYQRQLKNYDLIKDRLQKRKKSAQETHNEDEVSECNQGIRQVMETKKNLVGRQFLQYLAQESLLPNYAFPARAITMESYVFTPTKKYSQDTPKPETRTYVRSPGNALGEFAPYNTFYGNNRKVRINRIELEQSKDQPIEKWKICEKCHYLEEQAGDDDKSKCPVCGTTSWSDVGREFDMVRLSKVAASTSTYASKLGDGSDEREHKHYERKLHLKLYTGTSRGQREAYVNETQTFGYEYAGLTDLYELNLGVGHHKGSDINIGGEAKRLSLFPICPECGRVESLDGNMSGGLGRHAPWCKWTKKNDDKPPWKPVILYRHLRSEVMRLLIPLGKGEREKSLATWTAAVYLGLKKRFQGRYVPVHIHPQSEPVEDELLKRTYLILYDEIPGGTGYLREFGKNPDALREVLQLALETLRSCSCRNEEGMDGCYNCIYSYKLQYQKDKVSAELAINLLSELLKSFKMEKLEGKTLSKLDSTALEESELELKFEDKLKQVVESQSDADENTWKETFYSGKKSWRFQYNKMKWLLVPQERINEPGVNTRADFVLYPQGVACQQPLANTGKNTSPGSGVSEIFSQKKPVAIYTDGFKYHASQDAGDTLSDDFELRRRLVENGNYLVWSLTWDDVVNFGGTVYDGSLSYDGTALYGSTTEQSLLADGGDAKLFAGLCEKLIGKKFSKYFSYLLNRKATWGSDHIDRKFRKKYYLKLYNFFSGENSFENLLSYLALPCPELWSKALTARLFSEFKPYGGEIALGEGQEKYRGEEVNNNQKLKQARELSFNYNEIKRRGDYQGSSQLQKLTQTGGRQSPYFVLQKIDRQASLFGFISLDLMKKAPELDKLRGMHLMLKLADLKDHRSLESYKPSWNRVLATMNQLQFGPKFELITAGMIHAGVAGEELKPHQVLDTEVKDDLEGDLTIGSGWEEVEEEVKFDPQFKNLLDFFRTCFQEKIAPPQVGVELQAADGQLVAMGEVVWPKKKTTLILPDQVKAKEALKAAGWKVFVMKEELDSRKVLENLKN